MRKIGLLSDTHGFLDPKLFTHFESCHEVWHSGDFGSVDVSDQLSGFKTLRGVYGNIDSHELRKIHPEHLHFMCEDVRIWMTHIGGYPRNFPPNIRNELDRNAPDIFICGHSHILKIMRDKKYRNMLHINPGAAGKEGFHRVRTAVRFEISGREIKNMEVIELGLRGEII